MKKIVLIIGIALLSGCATANPHYQRAQNLTATATGAGAGWGLATLAGGNPSLQYAGAILGGILGNQISQGSQWEPPAQRSATATTGNVIVVHTTPAYSSGSCGYGRYENPWSGGCITQGFAERNPEYLCCNRLARSYSAVAYTTNERTATETKGSGRWLTVDNYLWSADIPPECKTINKRADAYCLLGQHKELIEKQKLCNAHSPSCPKTYAPYEMLEEYVLLEKDLLSR